MAQKVLSVYFTAELIRICEVSKIGKTIYVNRTIEEKMPLDCFADGMITDTLRLSQRMEEIFSDNHVKKGKLSFTIFSRKIANKETVLPFVHNLNKIQEIIEVNAGDYFPMGNTEDYVYRYKILEVQKEVDRKMFRLSLSAVPKDMIAGYYDLAAKLKLPISSIDYYANSMNSLFATQNAEGIRLALQVEKDMTNVNIMRGKTVLFRRMIPFGIDLLVQNLAQELHVEVQDMEDLFQNPAVFSGKITEKQYAEAVRDLTASITRVVEFHTGKNPDTVIDKGFVYGEGIKIPGLDERLALALGIQVTFARKLNGVVVRKNNKHGLMYENLMQYLPNIGSVISPCGFTTQESNREKEGEFTIFYILVILAAVCTIGCSVFFLVLQWKLGNTQREVAEQVAALQYAQETYDHYLDMQTDYDRIKAFYDSTKSDNEMLSAFFDDMERCIPEGIGFTNFSAQEGFVTLTGEANSKDAIALYVMKLKDLSYISNVRVSSISEAEVETGGIIATFNLSFALNLPAEESMEESAEEAEGVMEEVMEEAVAEGGQQE